MGCACTKQSTNASESAKREPHLYDNKHIFSIIRKTRKNDVDGSAFYIDRTIKKFFQGPDPYFTVSHVLAVGDEKPPSTYERVLIKFKYKSNYLTILHILAILSIKDPKHLHTIVNWHSVDDTPKIHLPQIQETVDSGVKWTNKQDEHKIDVDIKTTNTFAGYTNEKGYHKTLHLIQHGSWVGQIVGVGSESFRMATDFWEYIQTNVLQGKDLFYHSRETTKDNSLKISNYKIAGKIIKDILYGVKYLHDRNIVHRNIAPENIKFDVNNEIEKLTNDDHNDNDDTENDNDDVESNVNVVLIGYSRCVCLGDPKLHLLDVYNNYNSGDDYDATCTRLQSISEIEEKWNQRLAEDKLGRSGFAVSYSAPEVVFNEANKLSSCKTMEEFIGTTRERYNYSKKKINYKSRYDCEKLFGMTWQQRYEKWKNYDTLPIFENDNIKKDMWHRFKRQTPRMFKASDIWSVGTVAYLLVTSGGTWRIKNDASGKMIMNYTMENLLTQEYLFPYKHVCHGFPLREEAELPVTFQVKIY